MFRHFHLYRRQLKHLALFVGARRHLLQRRWALAATQNRMHADMLGMFDGFQGVTRMTRLTTWRLPTRGPQVVRPRFIQTITRGWLAAVAAILGQLILQCLDAGFQLLDDADQLQDQGDHRVFALLINPMHLFRCRQVKLIHTVQYDQFLWLRQDLESLTA